MRKNNYFLFKRDKYRYNRGDYSRFLNIYCNDCKNFILLYQKDGPGILKRLYLDRIFAPSTLKDLQNTTNINIIKNLTCPKCNSLIGIPTVYIKENRYSFNLQQGSIIKKLTKGIYPPLIKKLI